MGAANRVAYGKALVDLGKVNNKVVALDADLGKATNSIRFKAEFPERYIDCGIAEQNMIGIAAGLATAGKIPFASTFSIFAGLRAIEQVRNSVCYPGLNVKVVGTHAGLECGPDGASHQAVEDVAVMRSLPNMTVFVPSDHVMTRRLVFLMGQKEGAMFLRLGRDENEALYSEEETFAVGGSKELATGKDVAILACGPMVYKALAAAKLLESEGINARVLDMYSVKPLDKEAVIRSARETRGIVTVEDHSVVGGLGSAVAEVVTAECPTRVIRLGVNDIFGRSGLSSELFALYGLTAESIRNAAKTLL